MRRRDVLRATAGAAVCPAVAGRAAAPSDSGYGPLGSVAVPGAKEAVVGDDGETVYVAATTGFATVDVSDPRDPRILAERRDLLANREGGPLRGLQDAKVDGDRLIVAGPANPARNALNAVVVYDVSDPADPRRVGVHETEFYHHNVFLADGVAYLGGNGVDGNPLVTVDVTGEPRELGRWSITSRQPGWRDVSNLLWSLHDLWVQDGTAYLAHWEAGTWLVDVRDPADPSFLARLRGRDPGPLADLPDEEFRRHLYEPPGNDHYATVDDDASVLGVGVESWDLGDDGSGGPGGITLFDLADTTAPEPLATVSPPPTPDPTPDGVWTTSHNFELTGGRLYSSWYRGGVRLFDVRDPGSPEELAAWRAPETTSFWTARAAVPGEFFVASSRKDPSEEPDTERGRTARLYTFPDRAGRQADPPSLGNRSGTATGTPNATQSPANDTAREGTDAGGPGLGAPAALAGLGLGAWRYLRERGDD